MNKLILYKYSSDEESKIIEWMLKSRNIHYHLFDDMVYIYCQTECINPDEFNTEQFITLYIDTLKNYLSKDSILSASFNKVYVIISDKELDLIKDKLKDLDVLSTSIISLNIDCEEINDLPF